MFLVLICSLFCFAVLQNGDNVRWNEQSVANRRDSQESRRDEEGRIVKVRRRVRHPRRHDFHEPADGERLGLEERLPRPLARPEGGLEGRVGDGGHERVDGRALGHRPEGGEAEGGPATAEALHAVSTAPCMDAEYFCP